MTGENPGRLSAGTTLLFLSTIISGGIGGFLGNILTKAFLEGGQTHVTVWPWISATLFAGIGVGMAIHYWTILGYGAFAKGSRQRERYNRLRTGMRTGGHIGAAYERMLRGALDATDRFIGDHNRADRTPLSRAFGLKERAPLWTAPSYDLCLQIAFVYPIAVIFFVWVASGHVGPAENALRLSPELSAWPRGVGLVGAVLMSVGCYGFARAKVWQREFAALGIFVIGYAAVYAGVGLGGSSAVGSAFVMLALIRVRGLFSIFFAAGALAFIITSAGLAAGVAATAAATFGVVAFLGFSLAFFGLAGESATGWEPTNLHRWLGRLLLLSMPIAFLTAVAAPRWMALAWYWPLQGPLLLFYGVLTAVNAPFDWITLGLTRALLRRGLELGGWWPLVFGLIDLFAATVVVGALSVATLWSVQLFGHFTLLGGGELILDASKVLAGLADPESRTAPEYWWLYAMLFSTLIPSIINVALGALSLMRGVPGLHKQLARRMPLGAAVLDSERMWIAPVLALQSILAFAIGTVVMLGLIWFILEWALPLIGLNLVSMLQALADEDLPGQLLSLMGLW